MADRIPVPLTADRKRFIPDSQEAFLCGTLEEFGRRDNHFKEEGETISRETMVASAGGKEAWRPEVRSSERMDNTAVAEQAAEGRNGHRLAWNGID